MAQEDHVVLRVRIGLLVERLDQLIEEVMLVSRAHEQDAVGAFVGEKSRARAEAERRTAGDRGGRTQHRVELVDHVGRHRILERVALRHDEIELRAVNLGDEGLNLLQVRDRIRDEEGVVAAEVDRRSGQRRIEARDDLRDEFLGVGVLEREDLRRDPPARRQGEGGTRDKRWRFGFRDEVRDDFQELVALLDDGDAVEVEQRLDGEQGFIAGDRGGQSKRVSAGGKGLRAEDGFTGPALHQVEHLGDGLIAEDDWADQVRAAQAREGDGGRHGGDRRGGGRSSWSGLGEAQGGRHGGS